MIWREGNRYDSAGRHLADRHYPRPAIVFDPFAGSGTTLVVAEALGRRAIGCDLSREYLEMASQRINRPHKPIRSAGKVEHHPLFAGQE